MPRGDTHTDAMLRHLGAAYYESLHGRASAADVARARAAIEERLAEQPDATDQPEGGKRHAGRLGAFHTIMGDFTARCAMS